MTEPRPFKIQIFVAEGVPDGLRIVEKSNWIGQGIVCPRGRWPHVKSRSDFDKSGVYILVGRDGEDDRPTLYIGEAETVRSRTRRGRSLHSSSARAACLACPLARLHARQPPSTHQRIGFIFNRSFEVGSFNCQDVYLPLKNSL